MIRTHHGRQVVVRGEGGTRARACNPLPGSFGLFARSALRPVREKHRCTETGKLRGKPDGGLLPGSAELKLGSGVRSPKPEPRWNADRCAPGAPGAAGPAGPANTRCVCRRSASESFSFRPYPFVIAGPKARSAVCKKDPAIHAVVPLANASTGICLLQLSMDHRHRRVKRRRSANGYARW